MKEFSEYTRNFKLVPNPNNYKAFVHPVTTTMYENNVGDLQNMLADAPSEYKKAQDGEYKSKIDIFSYKMHSQEMKRKQCICSVCMPFPWGHICCCCVKEGLHRRHCHMDDIMYNMWYSSFHATQGLNSLYMSQEAPRTFSSSVDNSLNKGCRDGARIADVDTISEHNSKYSTKGTSRKNMRKLIEKQRRRDMKILFDQLEKSLPRDKTTKMSKWEILTEAATYIENMCAIRSLLLEQKNKLLKVTRQEQQESNLKTKQVLS